MMTEAQRRANDKYNKEHTTQVLLRLNNRTDEDVIAWLKTLSNKQGYIKELIRKDIKRKRLKRWTDRAQEQLDIERLHGEI